MSTNSGGNVSSKASSGELIASGTASFFDPVWSIILQLFGLPAADEGYFLHITLGSLGG